eukprot:2075400-Pleurochrysis_carterae.AAC.1
MGLGVKLWIGFKFGLRSLKFGTSGEEDRMWIRKEKMASEKLCDRTEWARLGVPREEVKGGEQGC